jgi:hypothetical protein
VADASVIDLRDKANPPPDDPEKAPYGYRWDTRKREWAIKRSAGGRKSGAGWFGKDNADAVEERVEEVLEERGFSDPAPAWANKPAPKAKTTRTAAPKVTAKVKGDMSAAVGMMMMVTGPAIMAKDPYCGGVFLDNSQKITDAVIPLLCRSHTVVAFFSDSTENGWLLWFNLALALSPVAMAIGKHHIIRSVEIKQDTETGDLFVVPRDMEDYGTGEIDEEVPA